MRIALAHDFLTGYTGAERVLKVIADIYPEAPIFTLLYDEAKMGSIFPPNRVHTSFLQKLPRWLRRRRRLLLPFFPTAVEKLDLSEFDLIISSSTAWVKGIIPKLKTTHVCYCHSPMRFAWDWTHEYQREHKLRGLKGFLASYYLHKIRVWDAISAARVDHYAASSQIVRDRIAKYYRRQAEVIYPPVDLDRFTKLPIDDKGYYLVVSRLEPYKRIDLAIQALRARTQRQLVIVGEGSAAKALRKLASGANNIRLLGALPDDEVDRLYANCHAFLFLGEDDFGLTPVEAMACGKPVVAFAAGGALETVAPGKTGYFFNEPTLDSLLFTLDQLEDNFNKFDPDAIKQHASQFSARAFREHFSEFVDDVLAEERLNIVHLGKTGAGLGARSLEAQTGQLTRK